LAAFSLTRADVIRGLLADAGFAHASVSLERLTVSVPSAEALVQWLAAGSPSVRHNLALLPTERRQDFSERVAARLRPYKAAAALELPSARHVLVGW
jgi:hypothetical protein